MVPPETFPADVALNNESCNEPFVEFKVAMSFPALFLKKYEPPLLQKVN